MDKGRHPERRTASQPQLATLIDAHQPDRRACLPLPPCTGPHGVLRHPADVAAAAAVGVVVTVGAKTSMLLVPTTVAELLVPEMARRYDGHR